LAHIVKYRNLFSKDFFLKEAIDVSCDSRIFLITVARLGFETVHGVGIDPAAVQIDKKNAAENDVSSVVSTTARVNEGIVCRRADLIIANALVSVLIEHASLFVNMVKKHRARSLSGILVEEVESVKAVVIQSLLRLVFVNGQAVKNSHLSPPISTGTLLHDDSGMRCYKTGLFKTNSEKKFM
jgi:ribosomal protein L11 methylase PrmA